MKHPLRRVSLQAWLVAAFVAVGTAASIAVLVVLLPRLEPSVKQQQRDRALTEAVDVVNRFAATDLNGFRRDEEQFVYDVFLTVRGKNEVRLVHPTVSGLRVGASYPTVLSLLPSRATASAEAAAVSGKPTSAASPDQGVLEVAVPVTTLDQSDVVELAIELPDLQREVIVLRTRVLLAVAAVLALASLVGLVISRLLSHRIGRLATTASTLAGGDLAARAPETSPRELAELSSGLNRMASRLAQLVDTTTSERDRIRELVASLDEGVVAIRADGSVSVTNPAASSYVGHRIAADDAHVDDLPVALAAQVREVLARPDEEPDLEEITLDDGRVLMVNASRLPKSDGVVLTLHDVTHERRLERARRDLIANVSHELRTPLTALKGFLELLENEGMSAEHRREFLDRMSQEAGRLERLVVEQLELARLDSGALPLEPHDVDLLELAEGVTESRYPLFAREGVDLGCQVVSGGPFVARADPARVEQILLILLDNALRHTPAKGRVSLRVGREGEEILLGVCDDGEGIPADAQPFVFDRFYRADPSREGRGTGLGLAIARGLAEAHGGSIVLASTVGVGTTFTLRLPVAVPAPSPGAPAAV